MSFAQELWRLVVSAYLYGANQMADDATDMWFDECEKIRRQRCTEFAPTPGDRVRQC